MDVGTETDGQLQEAQAALEAQRSQAKALKRRILELQVCGSCLNRCSRLPAQRYSQAAECACCAMPVDSNTESNSVATDRALDADK